MVVSFKQFSVVQRLVMSLMYEKVLSGTNQTTPNHEGYHFLFHVLNFNLKLHV